MIGASSSVSIQDETYASIYKIGKEKGGREGREKVSVIGDMAHIPVIGGVHTADP